MYMYIYAPERRLIVTAAGSRAVSLPTDLVAEVVGRLHDETGRRRHSSPARRPIERYDDARLR